MVKIPRQKYIERHMENRDAKDSICPKYMTGCVDCCALGKEIALEMVKSLRNKMYTDLLELGLIDDSVPREEINPHALWGGLLTAYRGNR